MKLHTLKIFQPCVRKILLTKRAWWQSHIVAFCEYFLVWKTNINLIVYNKKKYLCSVLRCNISGYVRKIYDMMIWWYKMAFCESFLASNAPLFFPFIFLWKSHPSKINFIYLYTYTFIILCILYIIYIILFVN